MFGIPDVPGHFASRLYDIPDVPGHPAYSYARRTQVFQAGIPRMPGPYPGYRVCPSRYPTLTSFGNILTLPFREQTAHTFRCANDVLSGILTG